MWVLLIFVVSGNPGGQAPALTTQEFTSETSCLWAKEHSDRFWSEAKTLASGYEDKTDFSSVCVPK